ncbi:hypothetical protein CJF31_00009758 [Rutstroemia sp. NJR-2017a BVV2]|nr:hypothetical protein CJF31_00009758 [Rutstroemia sp. NJR-2017a BVV2]
MKSGKEGMRITPANVRRLSVKARRSQKVEWRYCSLREERIVRLFAGGDVSCAGFRRGEARSAD